MSRILDLASGVQLDSIVVKNTRLGAQACRAFLKCLASQRGLKQLVVQTVELSDVSWYAALVDTVSDIPEIQDLAVHVGFATRQVENVEFISKVNDRIASAGNENYLARLRLVERFIASHGDAPLTTNEQKMLLCLNEEVRQLQSLSQETRQDGST